MKKLFLSISRIFGFALVATSSTYASSKSYSEMKAELDQLNAAYSELEQISKVEENKCGSKLTSADMISCSTNELKQWWILMASLRDYVSDIPDEESRNIFKENFAKSQRAWEEYVVSDCKFRSSKYYGGSLAGVVHAFCHVEANKLRAKELLTILKNP